jgi:hypothetical protein
MTESTVLATFIKKLRASLQDAVVFKHNDAGLIGLPDCSVTWLGRTLWLEAKLLDVPTAHKNMRFRTDDPVGDVIRKRLSQAPVQLETCRRLSRAGLCLYVIFFRKAGIYFYEPITESIIGTCAGQDEAVRWVENYILMTIRGCQD